MGYPGKAADEIMQLVEKLQKTSEKLGASKLKTERRKLAGKVDDLMSLIHFDVQALDSFAQDSYDSGEE